MKRIKANDPVAMRREGLVQYKKGDYISLYHRGQGVEKDREKKMYHLEEAAIGGHPEARHYLGCIECNLDGEVNGNIERAKRHLIIAAVQGYDRSIEMLLAMFKDGFVSKDDLAAALRANQAAVDATKSPQRDAAEEYDQSC
eukprot:scaffold12117_cov76-Skeletonema_marinoi.AAC.1